MRKTGKEIKGVFLSEMKGKKDKKDANLGVFLHFFDIDGSILGKMCNFASDKNIIYSRCYHIN